MAKKSFQTRILESPKDNLDKLRKQMPLAGGQRLIAQLAGAAKGLITQRTSAGISSSGSTFAPYKTGGTYYAPVERRPPGYPKPTGGRTTHEKTGAPLKSVAYDTGYGGY